MTEPTIDAEALATAIEKDLARGPIPFARERSIERNQLAMRSVDRSADRERLAIEAFVDQALHMRIQQVRGAYTPGARDAHVRAMLLEWLNTISNDNAHTL